MKYKLVREIKIRVIDYVDAVDKIEALKEMNNRTPLTAEISGAGLVDKHTCVMYDDYKEYVD